MNTPNEEFSSNLSSNDPEQYAHLQSNKKEKKKLNLNENDKSLFSSVNCSLT